MNHKLISMLLLAAITASPAAAFDEEDFSSGIFVLNEDWYGHQNSTINMWYPDDTTDPDNPVYYRIFQSVNLGRQLGCTAQYGQIFGNRLYIIAKQYQDPGSNVPGGRLTVIDAKTMKCLHQAQVINPLGVPEAIGNTSTGTVSGSALGDGRGCCGVTPDKMYIGTSNGIYILNLETYEINGPISGTENPLASSGDNNIDGQGPLYQNQIGMMIRTQDYVFAIMQDKGILCIDPQTDRVVNVIEGCFSTMVQAADGSIWAGMNLADPAKTNDYGIPLNRYPYGNNGSAWDGGGLLRIDPYSLETRQVKLYIGGVPQSWYAWTAGKMTASARRNVIYFTYADPSTGQGGWFSDCKLYRYDIDRDFTDLIYDSSLDGLWFYSSSLRVSPVDDKLYCHFYYGATIANQDWVYMRFTDDGSGLTDDAEWKLIRNYWYPAMFIFPDTQSPKVSSSMPRSVTVGESPVTIALSGMVTDSDTPAVSIVKRITANSNPEAVEARIVRGDLVLTSLHPGESHVTIQFDSNGLTASHTLSVIATATTSAISSPEADLSDPADVFDLSGRRLRSGCPSVREALKALPAGVYIVRQGSRTSKHVIK